MFGLIAAGIAGASGVFGHIKSRHFVGQKLRYTKIVETPLLGVWVGAATTVALGAVLAIPLVPLGAGTALAVGAGVGTGVALGQKDAKEPPKLLDD